MRRAIWELRKANSPSFVKRASSLAYAKDKIKQEKILSPADKSQDQPLQGPSRVDGRFTLADREEFNRLKKTLAEMKIMFVETKNSLMSLKQLIMNGQYGCAVDGLIQENNELTLVHRQQVDGSLQEVVIGEDKLEYPKDFEQVDGSVQEASAVVEKEADEAPSDIHDQHVTDPLIPEDLVEKSPITGYQHMNGPIPDKIEGNNRGLKSIIPSVTEGNLERQVQVLKTEHEHIYSWFRKVKPKFDRTMHEIHQLKHGAPSLIPLKVNADKMEFWIGKKLKDLTHKIRNFENSEISEALPAISFEEVVKLINVEIAEVISSMKELETTLLKSREEIKRVKKGGCYVGHAIQHKTSKDEKHVRAPWWIEDEVKELSLHFGGVQKRVDRVVEAKKAEVKDMSEIEKLRKTMSWVRSMILEKEGRIVNALQENEKLKAYDKNEVHKWQMMKWKLEEMGGDIYDWNAEIDQATTHIPLTKE